jgi:ribonuclease HI
MDNLRVTLGLRCVVYMDDMLILGKSATETQILTMNTVTHLISLGWTISWEKCRLIPQQTIEFVGWLFDFRTMTLRTTRHRRVDLLQQVHEFNQMALRRERTPVRRLAKLLGSLNFLRLQVEAASLYMSVMNMVKTRTVKRAGWTASLRLTPIICGELKWWLRTLSHNTPHQLRAPTPDTTLVTDASPEGWGACLQRPDTEVVREWGVWPAEFNRLSSNYNEFMAILLALKSLRGHLSHTRTIRVLSDNTTAVFNIRRWKGVRQRVTALRLLHNLCLQMRWTLISQHIPGAGNGDADALSRMGSTGEYYLSTRMVNRILQLMPRAPTLDVFASRATHVLPRYMTLDRFDGGAVAIDGLSASWADEIVWLHPPLNLILRTLRIVETTRATGVIVVPDWRGQPWFPLLQRLSQDQLPLGSFVETMTKTPAMTERGLLLPPGNAMAHFLGMKMMPEKSCSTT